MDERAGREEEREAGMVREGRGTLREEEGGAVREEAEGGGAVREEEEGGGAVRDDFDGRREEVDSLFFPFTRVRDFVSVSD